MFLKFFSSPQTDNFGVRRSSVTVAAGNLNQAGLIDYKRGRITILDRAALVEFSCECYGIIRDEFTQMLGDYST